VSVLFLSDVFAGTFALCLCEARKEQQNKKLRDEKCCLADEVDELKSKVHRMSTMTRQVRVIESLIVVFVNRDNCLLVSA